MSQILSLESLYLTLHFQNKAFGLGCTCALVTRSSRLCTCRKLFLSIYLCSFFQVSQRKKCYSWTFYLHLPVKVVSMLPQTRSFYIAEADILEKIMFSHSVVQNTFKENILTEREKIMCCYHCHLGKFLPLPLVQFWI